MNNITAIVDKAIPKLSGKNLGCLAIMMCDLVRLHVNCNQSPTLKKRGIMLKLIRDHEQKILKFLKSVKSKKQNR